MAGIKRALLVSEAGYRGMKQLSPSLLKNGLSVDIIIKGRVDREVLDVITRPAGLTIRAIPRIFFIPYLFFYLVWHNVRGDLKRVVVSKKQTGNWIRGFCFDAKVLIEAEKGYKIN